MKFTVKEDNILFYFHPKELTNKLKSVLSIAQAEYHSENRFLIKNKMIANLNIHEVKTLGLPPIYPYRLRVSTRGKPITPAFSFEVDFLNQKSQKFYSIKRIGVILELDQKQFTLTNPHFIFLENLEKLSSEVKTPGERLTLWSQIIKHVPKEVVLDNQELLEFQFIKADRFCVDQKKMLAHNFCITPELVYSDENKEEKLVTHQLPNGISKDFKESFLNINSVDPYYKVGSYYIQISKPLRECLKVIKKINKEPIEKKRAFYENPMERIKKEIPDNLSEDLLEDIFFETDHFKSDRISHIGKWIPKLGIYIDPDNKNPWFPEDGIAIKIEDSLLYFNPDDIDSVIENLEKAKKEEKEYMVYENQTLPVNDKVVSELKNVKDKIVKEFNKLNSGFSQAKDAKKQEKSKLSKKVAIIKDNIDQLQYEKNKNARYSFKKLKGIPQVLRSKFLKYPHQEEGVYWLEDNFITGKPGVLLADDMGLGKTFQTLAFLYWYKKEVQKNFQKKPILIVAPTGLLKNWENEHEIHLYQYGGIGRKYEAYGELFRKDRKESVVKVIKEMEQSDWVLTTYESVRDHHRKFFIKIDWSVVIFDEIQKIKNPNSLMTDASKALASDFSIGLTGTPIENSFTDIWCISDCLYPKLLGLLKDFHNKYIKNKTKGSAKEIQEQLFSKKPPFIMRRMKKDILNNLPKKEVIIKKMEMTKEQQFIYSGVVQKVKNKEYLSLQALSLLRRYSIYVQDCFKGSDEEFIESSAKLKFLFSTLQEIKKKNEKALICMENRFLQKKIKSICDAKWNLDVKIINGEMLGDIRTKTVDLFGKKEGFNILIISPRAGGVGLNIVSANHIIHLERWWNPAVEDQSNDRIFRIGQKKPVFIYYPLSFHPVYKESSFDVILNNILENKRKIREEALMPAEPSKQEKHEFYRTITGEEWLSDNKSSFYHSEAWQELRKQVFQKYPYICGRCGNKNHLEVDHVKPRSKYPDLELELGNLQILCRDCNLLKGTQDSTEWDFRKTS